MFFGVWFASPYPSDSNILSTLLPKSPEKPIYVWKDIDNRIWGWGQGGFYWSYKTLSIHGWSIQAQIHPNMNLAQWCWENGWEKYGTLVLTNLPDGYALMCWDQIHHKISLIRDYLGRTPLYYTLIKQGLTWCYGDHLQTLLSYCPDSISVNHKMIGSYLISTGDAPLYSSQTFYREIMKIPCAQILEYHYLEGNTTIYSFPPPIKPQPNPSHRSNEYQLCSWFAQELMNRIETILHDLKEEPVIALSGGLDSAVLAGLCSLSGSPYTLTMVPPLDKDDESLWSQYYSTIFGLPFYPIPTQNWYLHVHKLISILGEPYPYPNLYDEATMLQTTHQLNSHFLLHGYGGDIIFKTTPDLWIRKILSDGSQCTQLQLSKWIQKESNPQKIISWLSTILHIQPQITWKHLLALYPWIPHSVDFYTKWRTLLFWSRAWLKKIPWLSKVYHHYTKKQNHALAWNPYILLSFAQEYYLHEELQSLTEFWHRSYQNFDPISLLQQSSGPWILEQMWQLGIQTHVLPFFPYLQDSLLELSLTLPEEFHFYNGWDRWCIRAGLEGILPGLLTWKDRKTHWGHTDLFYWQTSRTWLYERFLALRPFLRDYINLTKAQNAFLSHPYHGEELSTSLWRQAALWRILCLGEWLYWWSEFKKNRQAHL